MIAGIGFARMAWSLAKDRAGVPNLPDCFTPNRAHGEIIGKSSWHYYRIIDSATASWPAFAGERSIGVCSRVVL